MSTTFSRSPKLLNGAIVEFSERFIGPVPNVIVFQYNPEKLTRTLGIWSKAGEPKGAENITEDQTAQPFDPVESFNLVLEFDAADDLEKPDLHPVAVVSGVANRLAVLEMLLYPQESSLLGELAGSITGSLSGKAAAAKVSSKLSDPLPRGTVPLVFLVWGPGRIVPVRLTSFSIEEHAYLPTLYPIRATATVGMKILRPDDLSIKGSIVEKGKQELAKIAYQIYVKQKTVLAASNIANNVESILGMLPF